MAIRLTIIEDKTLISTALKGLKNAPNMSLEGCLTQAAAQDTDFGAEDLDSNVFLASMFATAKKDELPDSPLSTDQIASIHLYTQESPFYGLINSKLRAADRKALVPLFPLLKLLLSALDLLPRHGKTVYRGVASDLHAWYKEKEKMIWWSVTSTTGNIKTLENEQFCGKSGPRTIFAVADVPVVYIGNYSAVEIEDEYIVLPGTVLEVANIADLGSELHMIQLKHVPSPPLVDLFHSAAQKVGCGTAATAGGTGAGQQHQEFVMPAAGGGSSPVASTSHPPWMMVLPVGDDVRAIFVKEDIDEETFECLGERDLEKLGVGMGPCKRLSKEIANRKEDGAKQENEDKPKWGEKVETKEPEKNKVTKTTPPVPAELLALFSDPPGDWSESKPVAQWSGIKLNDAGEVIEIAVDSGKHTVADANKFPSTLRALDLSNTSVLNSHYVKVTDEAIKLVAANCPQLNSLNVESTYGKVTDESLKLIAANCRQLQSLNVSKTQRQATDESLKLIATNCPQLQSLNVGFTYGSVTDEAIKLIATSSVPNDKGGSRSRTQSFVPFVVSHSLCDTYHFLVKKEERASLKMLPRSVNRTIETEMMISRIQTTHMLFYSSPNNKWETSESPGKK